MNYSIWNQTCYHSLEWQTPVSIFIKNRDKVHKTWIFKNSKDWFELRQGTDSKKNTKKGKTPSIHHLFSPQVFQKKIWLLDSYWSEGYDFYSLLSEKTHPQMIYWNLHMISQPSGTSPSRFPQILGSIILPVNTSQPSAVSSTNGS